MGFLSRNCLQCVTSACTTEGLGSEEAWGESENCFCGEPGEGKR